jgi:hypothetical protein
MAMKEQFVAFSIYARPWRGFCLLIPEMLDFVGGDWRCVGICCSSSVGSVPRPVNRRRVRNPKSADE